MIARRREHPSADRFPRLQRQVPHRSRHARDLRQKAQGAKTGHQRGHVYFGNALNLLSEHVRESDHPLFADVLTMAAHGPYPKPYQPGLDVPGGGAGTHQEMHEYLRRLSMARMDLEDFKRELKTRFPGEPILLVQYGDRPPIATRHYLGFGNVKFSEDDAITQEQPGFLTY